MNLESRIKKLEVAVAALPEINREHVEALGRFFETGDVNVLPEECVSRSETLMVVRILAEEILGPLAEPTDKYPGLTVIAEAMTAERLWGDVHLTTASATAALAVLSRLGPTDSPFPVIYCPEFSQGWTPGPAHQLLAGLGLIQLFRIVYRAEPTRPKPDTV